MASNFKESKARRSIVGDLIDFQPNEDPEWRDPEDEPLSVKCMIQQIASYQHEWEGRTFTNDSEMKKIFFLEFILHCNLEEGHGCGTLEDTKNCLDADKEDERTPKKAQETINLVHAYEHLLDIKKEESDKKLHGFIEESMLRDTNKIILEGISHQQYATKPGVYSNKPRITEFNGEIYEYPYPNDMHLSVVTCLDKFNSLYSDAQSESDDEKKLEKLFKTCSWLVFEMLDLHPFGDGNGRLCRLLCSYVLSTCTPFPSPIYNMFSKSSKGHYKKALVDARKSTDRHPCSLTTMIIECNYFAWKKFIEEVEKLAASKN